MLNEQLCLREPIGSGAMGSVWLAEDRSLDRLVAVKLVASELGDNAAALARFRREASLAAKIKSPHVVEIHGHGVSREGTPFIVMERLEGRSLATRAAQGPLPLREVREIVVQLGRALSPAHALGVVHRDIKPANLFLVDAPGYEVFVKVVDFGIAKQGRTGADALTATGAVIGTPWYMSPEQLMSTKDADHRADLWALAVMAYQLLTGQLPFHGDTIGAVSVAVSKGEFTPISRLAGESFAPLDHWFARALAVDIDRRYQSAEALTAAFADATRALVAPNSAPAASPDDEPVDGDSTAAFIGRRQLAVDVEPAAHTAPAANAATGHTAAAPEGDPPRAAPADLAPDERAATPPRRAPRRATWLVAGLALATLAGLGLWRAAPLRSVAAVPSAPAPGRTVPPTATPPNAAASSAGSALAANARSARGRLPAGHVQEVFARHFDALATCTESNDGPERARVRTLRFVIAEDGSTRDVHVAESDPRTTRFDACLVGKVAALRFGRPDGGIVTVSYPITFAAEGWAPLDDGACELANDCLEMGRCSAAGGRCVVRENADCALARPCTRQGLCRADKGRCVAGPDGGPATAACRRHGLCAVEAGIARATTDEHCRSSLACSRFGLCAARSGACVVDSDESCHRSEECREHGRCVLSGSSCVAGSDADCRRSADCEAHGLCALRFPECAARSSEDCRRSRDCRESGRCEAGALGRCVATNDADCRRSVKCAEADRCVAVEGACAVKGR